jgi:hypothetical protein
MNGLPQCVCINQNEFASLAFRLPSPVSPPDLIRARSGDFCHSTIRISGWMGRRRVHTLCLAMRAPRSVARVEGELLEGRTCTGFPVRGVAPQGRPDARPIGPGPRYLGRRLGLLLPSRTTTRCRGEGAAWGERSRCSGKPRLLSSQYGLRFVGAIFLEATNNRQQAYKYGSTGKMDFFFVAGK